MGLVLPVGTRVLLIKSSPCLTALIARKCNRAQTRSKFASRVGPLVFRAFLLAGGIVEEQSWQLVNTTASLQRWQTAMVTITRGMGFDKATVHSRLLWLRNNLAHQVTPHFTRLFIMFSHYDLGQCYRL